MSGSWIASFLANISYQRRYPDHGLFDSVCAYTTNNESHSCVMLSRVKRASVPFKNACSAYVLFLLIRFYFYHTIKESDQSKISILQCTLFKIVDQRKRMTSRACESGYADAPVALPPFS